MKTIDSILGFNETDVAGGVREGFDKIYILDTNILLEDALNLYQISDSGKNLIVLPETVIDELDAKKSGFNEINYQAREFGRILSTAENLGIKTSGNLKILRLKIDEVRVDIIQSQYSRELSSADVSSNDKKIIQVAEESMDYYNNPETVLLSNDVMCRTRAIMSGINSTGLMGTEKPINPEFIKVLDVEDVDLQGELITDYDESYEPQNYCYHLRGSDGNQKLAYIINKRIEIIDEEMFGDMVVTPLNQGQRFASAGMLDPRINIAVVEAIAGSGKNLLAIATGMKTVKQGLYDKIIYIRNSVESTDKAEEVGFLPGLESKFEIYNYPLYDTLEFISQKATNGFVNGKKSQFSSEDTVDGLVEKYNIETMWNGSIRGRTLSRAFVIVDEVQNFSKKSLQTVITRLDKDCKLVLIGSNRQIDHPYITKHTNGLSVVLDSMTKENNEVTLFGTEMNAVVRGKITEYAERIFETVK